MKNLLIKLLLVASLFPSASIAGGPFFVDKRGNGLPLLWGEGRLRWIADAGRLSPKVSNETAVGWLKELFEKWRNASLETASGDYIDVADIDIEYGGLADGDIDAGNYADYIDNDGADAVIIFDSTGEIIDTVLGGNAHNYVIGFASPVSAGQGPFVGGIVVLNGLFIDGDAKKSPEAGEEEFKAAILHELGHLLNLDHTQANIEAAGRFEGGDRSLGDEIPTMYPVLYTKDQLNLHADDVIALAEQYPSGGYELEFCRITGELKGTDGEGFQGADVVARGVDPVYEWSDVRTVVSGVMYPAGTKNGGYALGGIVPGREYRIGYRGINPSFTGGSSIAPYDPPRSNVISAVIADDVVVCSRGGESMTAETAKVESKGTLLINPLPDGGSRGEDADATAPSGGCSLIAIRSS